jgi:hypothetical protein
MATRKARPAAALLGGQVVTDPGNHYTAPATDQTADFSGVITAPNESALDMLRTMATTLREKMREAQRTAEAAEVAAADLTSFQMVALPEAMLLAGVTDFTLSDGSKLSVKEDVKAAITIANREEAHQWLRDHGHGSVIKIFWEIDLRSFTMDQLPAIEEVLRVNLGLEPEAKESVHNATLKSLVKEILEAGTTLPPVFSVHQFKKAELKEPKAK